MQDLYRMYRRSNGTDYLEDVRSRRQESLRTKDVVQARQLLAARNQAAAQPVLNITMAKAYLAARSPELAKRNWNDVFEETIRSYEGST